MEKLLLKPGDEVGNYVLLQELASGGTAQVYSARHQVFGYTRALKIMQLREALKEDAMARWQREAVLLSKIQHGNIVRVHDAGVLSSHGLFWIAMDLLMGQTLRDMLNTNPRVFLPPALYYGAQIADGVQAAHEMHVVHRDIKPENVFITEANEVKVLDLGTAKAQGYGVKTTDHFKVRGTLLYMAPEQCEPSQVDARTDVYALGLVVYEMLAGWHPFVRPGDPIPTPQELVMRQLVADPVPLTEVLPGLPEYVWQVVERAVQKDPNRRYGSMLEFGHALRETRRRALVAAEGHRKRSTPESREPAPAAPQPASGNHPNVRRTVPVLEAPAPMAGIAVASHAAAPHSFAEPPFVAAPPSFEEAPAAFTAKGTFRMPTARRDDLKAALDAAEHAGKLRAGSAPPPAMVGGGLGARPGAGAAAQQAGAPPQLAHAVQHAQHLQQGHAVQQAHAHAPQQGQAHAHAPQQGQAQLAHAQHAQQAHAQQAHPHQAQQAHAQQAHAQQAHAHQAAEPQGGTPPAVAPPSGLPPAAGPAPSAGSGSGLLNWIQDQGLSPWHGLFVGVMLSLAVVAGVVLGERAAKPASKPVIHGAPSASAASQVSLPAVSASAPAPSAVEAESADELTEEEIDEMVEKITREVAEAEAARQRGDAAPPLGSSSGAQPHPAAGAQAGGEPTGGPTP